MSRRRSARSSTQKPTSYAVDVYRDIAGSDGDTPIRTRDDSEEGFESPAIGDDAGVPDEDEDDISGDSNVLSDDAGEASDDDGSSKNPVKKSLSKAPTGGAAMAHRKHSQRLREEVVRPTRKQRAQTEGVDMRVPDPSVRMTYRPGFVKSVGKRERITRHYGEDDESLLKAILVRDHWLAAPAVPSREGLAFTPFWREKQDDIVELGEGQQAAVVLDFGEGEANRYLPPEGEPIKCILGPLGRQEAVTFPRFGMTSLGSLEDGRSGKKGYILNAGGQVVSMVWATNRPKGTQYVVLTTIETAKPNMQTQRSPAFDPNPGPSSIQIWRFPAGPNGEFTSDPSLALVLCHDWGPARDLKWCPVPRKLNERDLGYLAAVYRDGRVRVLHVILPDEDQDGCCSFFKFSAAAFECSLPEVMCTSVCWGSNHDLIVGTTDGCIAAWDLEHALPSSEVAAAPFTPYLYLTVAHTYITSLTTCYPSFPHHLVVASMDGWCRLVDLHDPLSSTISNNRSRTAPSTVAWQDAANVAIACEEGAWVKFYPLRRFFSATSQAKHAGVVTSVAASAFHSSLLSAGSEGEAVFCNPVRRTFHPKIKNYQHTWLLLEYSDVSGMYRMLEGFKCEQFEGKAKQEPAPLSSSSTASRKSGNVILSTVYPMQVALSVVAWNQNLPAAGWASVAGVCGLVRVEDVATDGLEDPHSVDERGVGAGGDVNIRSGNGNEDEDMDAEGEDE